MAQALTIYYKATEALSLDFLTNEDRQYWEAARSSALSVIAFGKPSEKIG